METMMNLLDKIRSRKAETPPPSPGRLRASANDERYTIPSAEQVEQQARLFAQLSWLQIAIGIGSQTAASAELHIQRNERKVKDHPLKLLLDRPNSHQSGFAFREATFAWRRLTGNAYWWLNTPSENVPPSEIFIIPANQIAPIPDGNMGVSGYRYKPGTADAVTLEPWEVVHFQGWNPLSRYVGLAATISINIDAQGDIASQRFSTNFYGEDNAKVGGILGFADNIDEGRWNRMQADIKEQHGSTKNKRMLLLRNMGPGGVQWITTQLSHQEMQYLEQRRFTKEEIFDLFAPGLSSVLAVNATEANSTAGKDTFLSMAIYPQHIAVAETIESQLLDRFYDPALSCAFDDVRRVDTLVELQQQTAYERTHTTDEVRKKYYGDPPLAPDARTVSQGAKPEPAPPQPIAPPQEAMVQAGKALDLKRWQTKAIKALVAGRSVDVPFDPDYLSDDEAMMIRAGLKRATSADDVGEVFR
jgi:HK97 family phage portal protein